MSGEEVYMQVSWFHALYFDVLNTAVMAQKKDLDQSQIVIVETQ